MARKKKPQLPSVGAAFAFPIGDGRFSVSRILLDTGGARSMKPSGKSILVACSGWIGDAVPQADEPALRPILHLNHHAWKGEPLVRWISVEPPSDLIPIGTIDPTAEEQDLPCPSYGGWSSITNQPLLQWRWDHDRTAVLAEDAVKSSAQSAARSDAERKRSEFLSRVTLEDLQGHSFFPNWKGYPSAEAIRAARDVMTQTVAKLRGLDPRATQTPAWTCFGGASKRSTLWMPKWTSSKPSNGKTSAKSSRRLSMRVGWVPKKVWPTSGGTGRGAAESIPSSALKGSFRQPRSEVALRPEAWEPRTVNGPSETERRFPDRPPGLRRLRRLRPGLTERPL